MNEQDLPSIFQHHQWTPTVSLNRLFNEKTFMHNNMSQACMISLKLDRIFISKLTLQIKAKLLLGGGGVESSVSGILGCNINYTTLTYVYSVYNN